ncbi:hypothetical protein EPUS_09166 [Endocarpon pusillum Z07020]|uniref:Uncharacterized protein n=1 Tax=Endocarpon pusillum (strain Z07020 / HMAS-L-300199) TaxID=1263415 RepID=U1HXL5_ENDPU|nr:uncharacterized protein EPUS_09166 [Endocarpon pusillum Z07020]ERF75570.1 hypothetical protein EPUS_09166 [Endocarpon pusillum Z07020]
MQSLQQEALAIFRLAQLASTTALLAANISAVLAFRAWAVPLLCFIFVLGLVSGVGSLVVVRTSSVGDDDSAARRWYAASLGFTLAHQLFSRPVLRQIKAIEQTHNAGRRISWP